VSAEPNDDWISTTWVDSALAGSDDARSLRSTDGSWPAKPAAETAAISQNARTKYLVRRPATKATTDLRRVRASRSPLEVRELLADCGMATPRRVDRAAAVPTVATARRSLAGGR